MREKFHRPSIKSQRMYNKIFNSLYYYFLRELILDKFIFSALKCSNYSNSLTFLVW